MGQNQADGHFKIYRRREKIRQNRIYRLFQHTGFDGYKAIIDDYPWEFSQIQLNIMDTEYQVGLKGLEYAASKNIPVVIMEPLKGGQILSIDNAEIKALKAKHGLSGVSTARIALNFLFDRREILCVLSGMGRTGAGRRKHRNRIGDDAGRTARKRKGLY
jgi:predicted aldo/keto reductase-like oxidoreductase